MGLEAIEAQTTRRPADQYLQAMPARFVFLCAHHPVGRAVSVAGRLRVEKRQRLPVGAHFGCARGIELHGPGYSKVILGEDAAGEFYITDIGSGKVYKIISTTGAATIISVTDLENGGALVVGSGSPFATYTILATGGDGISFAPIAVVNAMADGTFIFEDSYAVNLPNRRYRATLRN